MVWGVPGRIDDSTIWRTWLDSVNPSDLIYPAGLVFGISLVASEWWWPRIAMAIRARRHSSPPLSTQPTSGDSVGEIDNDLARFKECLPHVQRSRKLIQAYTGAFGTFEIGLQVFQSGGAKFGEIATELEYLTQKFSTLGIQSPDIWGEEGNDSFDKVHSRLRAWSSHLARLEAKIHQGDIKGARFQQE